MILIIFRWFLKKIFFFWKFFFGIISISFYSCVPLRSKKMILIIYRWFNKKIFFFWKIFFGIHSIFYISCVPFGPKMTILITFRWFIKKIIFFEIFFLEFIQFLSTVVFLLVLKRRCWLYLCDFSKKFFFF